jgi:sec-independent protein translocase protein TatC
MADGDDAAGSDDRSDGAESPDRAPTDDAAEDAPDDAAEDAPDDAAEDAADGDSDDGTDRGETNDGRAPAGAPDPPPELPYSRTATGEGDAPDEPLDEAKTDEAETDDGAERATEEATNGGTGATNEAYEAVSGAMDAVNTDVDFGGGAPSGDEELPLTAHLEEMLRRLFAVTLVVVVVAVVVFPFGEEIINFLWANALPNTGTRPHLYSPLELVITQIKVASLAGVVVALPVLVYESYLFMRPGLYPHERRYYLAAVPTSLVLAFVGLVFGYFVMLPTIFTYFYSYSKDVTDIAFALGRTFDLILVLLGYLAIVFQIPLLVMLAMMMGIVTREWLAARRLLFWGGFLGVSFLFSPDPTGMAPIILTLTMIALFEGTLFLTKWTRRGRERMSRG